jgi:hypothetical protein
MCFSTDSRIPMGASCVSLFTNFTHMRQTSHRGFSRKNKKKPARSFKLTFRCIDYVFLLHNSKFGAFVDRIYPIGFEIKDTTDTFRSVSYLDLHSEINSEGR